MPSIQIEGAAFGHSGFVAEVDDAVPAAVGYGVETRRPAGCGETPTLRAGAVRPCGRCRFGTGSPEAFVRLQFACQADFATRCLHDIEGLGVECCGDLPVFHSSGRLPERNRRSWDRLPARSRDAPSPLRG